MGFEHEILYVFCPQIGLLDFEGSEVVVDIYAKFNLIVTGTGDHVVVVSFHERNRPIEYPFRQERED